MSARISFCLAVALLMAAVSGASADSYRPSVGSAPAPSDNSAAGTPSALPSYSQAATNDPYNRPDFSRQQSFGLTASQMLGAAAACEQLHSERTSLSRQQLAKAARGASNDHASLDAAQQYMLDPAATLPNNLKAGEADCDRLSSSFSKLQQIQFQNQYLSRELDQPDAVIPSAKAPQPR